MNQVIRSADDIQVGTKVNLRVPSKEGGLARVYASMVQDITAEGLAVSMPTEKGKPVALPPGTALEVSLWTTYGDHRFPTRVLRRNGGQVPTVLLALPAPADITRVTQRQTYRVETRIPAKLRLGQAGEYAAETSALPVLILDLSVQGCRVQTPRPVKVGTQVFLDFILPFATDEQGLDRTKPLHHIGGQVKAANATFAASSPSAPETPLFFLSIEFSQLGNVITTLLLRYMAMRERELISQARQTGQPQNDPQVLHGNLLHLERQLREMERDDDPAPAEAAVPAVRTGVKQPPSPAGAQPVRPPTGKTILVAEDEAPLRKILAEYLAFLGHTVLEAGDGRMALDQLRREKVDLVITDLMMPKLNGWRLIATLREARNPVPVVLITGYLSEQGQEVLTSKDIAGYLAKPLDLEEVGRLAEKILHPERPDRPWRVLVVDDEEDIRTVVSLCLSHAGFRVEVCREGQEALLALPAFKPDLVLLDISMPLMDGFEVCRRLRALAQTAHTPVVMLTAKTSADYVRKAVALKISGYVAKPFDPVELVGRLTRILEGKG